MRIRKILAVVLLAILANGSAALAQITSGADTKLPWNGYAVQRIPDAYVPIIGRPGTTLISGSQNALNTTTAFNLPLPFAFRFLTTNYAAGFVLKISPAGYISFGNATTSGVPNLGQESNTLLIMPYWSDLQARDVPEGGIYWRVDGVAPNRVLTVEWRVMGVTTSVPTRNPGNFQAMLFETSNKIEFYYGPNSIDRTMIPPTNGAVVGLKNTGQPNTAPGSENDAAKFLLFTHPDQVRDTIVVTRTRYGTSSSALGVENTATWIGGVAGSPERVSRFWHYRFPTMNGVRVGYRMSAITNDVAPDQVLFEPSRPGNAYLQGSTFLVRGVFRNLGSNVRQNVPVTMQVLRGNTVLESRTGTAFITPTGTGGTSIVEFAPPITPAVTANPGTYTIRLISPNDLDPGLGVIDDLDPSNNILDVPFFVVFPRDVMPTNIIQPVSFTVELPMVYPVGSQVPVEGRFLNLGTTTLENISVGYEIRDASCNVIYRDNAVVRGSWAPLEYRDIVFNPWTVGGPGQYYIKIFTNFDDDDQISNDTLPKYPSCGRPFNVRYEREIEVREGSFSGVQPLISGNYALGRPVPVRVAYRNNGITDATNVPSTVEIRDPDGNLVYSRSLPNGVVTIPGEASGLGTTVFETFPDFVPPVTSRPGLYCVTATATDPIDPVRNNDVSRWCFTVKPPLAGTYYVGTGERFRTIQEANDSLMFYGVSAPVTFKLVDDIFIVRPSNNDGSLPALDARGDVIGSGPSRMVTWMAAEGKTNVRIILKSPSGIGIVYGQRNTINPTGYITWEGGQNKNLTFVLDTAGTIPPTKAIAFLFSQGSSNFVVRNVNIMPATLNIGLKDSSRIPMQEFLRNINTFTYTKDDSLGFSSGILIRNSAPSDNQNRNIGLNPRDTLLNQGNTFDGNVIKNFAFGISSIGAGVLNRSSDDSYLDFGNIGNRFINNRIDSVGRAGIMVTYEHNTEIGNNTITNVENNSTQFAHAVGIWASAGGRHGAGEIGNRGYSTNLLIQRNKVSRVRARIGHAIGVWTETAENVYFASASRTFRFPINGATNFRLWNNMMWDYRTSDATGRTIGAAITVAGDTRTDLVMTGNRVENNTIFNQIGSTNQEYGLWAQRAQGFIRNNIISILSPSTNPIGLVLVGPNIQNTVTSDYNLFWVPNGYVGALSRLSVNGFNIPSPPMAKTLNQWRRLTGLDQNSIEGNITADYYSITPGAENLHIRPTIVGSLANNRGITVTGMTTDIDGDPRNSGGNTSRPDIGADEFNGEIRNNDLLAEDILTPAGYRAQTGQFSDAEYVMADSLVALSGRFRNMGGLPQTTNTVRIAAEYFNPNTASWVPVASLPSYTQTTSFDVAQTRTMNFGMFAPRSLRQFGINDAYFGLNPNVTPLYRFRITSGTDDFSPNNTYEKIVRFYVRRSHRQAIVSVENRTTTMPADAIGKSNKLNADTLLGALDSINWERADGVGLEDFDLFERDRWPKESLNFLPWKTAIWAQGAEPQGLEPEERAALKAMLESGNTFNRTNLIMAGQDVARIHDVELNVSNGQVSDVDFSQNYLRADYRSNTNPAVYSNRVIRGVAINPFKFERIAPTGVAGDNAPMPGLLRPTLGDGIARATHHYWEQVFGAYVDSAAGVATAGSNRNVVYYAVDWRHYGRFQFEPQESGAQRLLLAALDFTNQYQGVVPVKVTSFEATQSGRKAVRVEWATASETDVASLEIERAVIERTEQGVREGVYTLVDRKAPAGSATRGANYNVLDANVEMGVEYRYRLVSVGLDGSRTVDATDEVKIIGAGEAQGYALAIMPNPVRTVATIELRMPETAKASVKLYDAAGRLVRVLVDRSELTALSTIELDVEDLASGVYTVTVETATTKLVQKVNVQK